MDTGADETLLPLSLAELLAVELEDTTSQAKGISGDQLMVHHGDVEFEIAGEGQTVRWRSTVGFVAFTSSDDEVIVLGHSGWLDYFTATFDGENAELELIPNALIPHVSR